MKPMQAAILIIPRMNSTEYSVSDRMLIKIQRMQLTFTITTDTEDLDDDEGNKEDRDPDTDVEIWAPEADSETSSGKFKREHGKP